MAIKRLVYVLLVVVALVVVAVPAIAQDDAIIADGLTNPRQMFYDADGNLYIADVGTAGPLVTEEGTAYGNDGSILMVTPDGEISPVLAGFISYREGSPLGVHAVNVTDESYWVLLGETTTPALAFSHALVEIDREFNRIHTFVDLYTFEVTEDPDGNPDGASNPTDFVILDDGSFLIVDSGCNCLTNWTPETGVTLAVAWSQADDNPVPTSVALGPDGDIYVGFLTGFPFPQGGSRIERWSGGELVQTYEGLTAVTDVLVTEAGEIYAVEHGVFEMGAGWGPGRVVLVSEDGLTPVMEGLTVPYGLAQAPDGTIAVSVGSTPQGEGAVLAVPTMQ
ncbi:MAG: ScyD/ScyE family protein [Chloroflexi bacterium]|nr:ScyD/ScyE family protein [Chloroflexota bacterium]